MSDYLTVDSSDLDQRKRPPVDAADERDRNRPRTIACPPMSQIPAVASRIGTEIFASNETFSRISNVSEVRVTYATWKNIPFPGKADLLIAKDIRNVVSAKFWNYFHIYNPLLVPPELANTAVCNICGRGFTYVNNGGSMRTHLKQKTSNKHIMCATEAGLWDTGDKGKKSLPKGQTTITWVKRIPPEELRKIQLYKMAVWIAVTDQPLCTPGKTSFRELLESFGVPASSKHFCALTVTDEIIRLEQVIREKVVESCKGEFVSLTIDHWSSSALQSYTAITIHWIDSDWQLHSLPLGCFLHTGDMKAESVLDDLLQKLFVQGGLREKINLVAVVSDTTGNMNKFGMILEEMNVPHLYCADHVLQLTAKDAYSNMAFSQGSVRSDVMTKARALVDHIRSSNQKVENLKNHQKLDVNNYPEAPLVVIGDVVTRWWSTHDMAYRLIYLKKALEGMNRNGQIDSGKWLSDTNWAVLKEIVDVLLPFKQAQKTLAGEKYVTISWLPLTLEKLRKNMREAVAKSASEADPVEDQIFSLSGVLLTDLNERWGEETRFNGGVIKRGRMNRQVGMHPTVLLATALDPRFKKLKPIPPRECEDVYKVILERMASFDPTANESIAISTNRPALSKERAAILAEYRLLNQSESDDSDEDGTSSTTRAEEELRRYRALKSMDIDGNPLDWWKRNASDFPILSLMARRLLAIPGSSSASERVFSQTSHILQKKRSSMSPQMVNCLLFVKNSICWYEQRQVVEESSSDEE